MANPKKKSIGGWIREITSNISLLGKIWGGATVLVTLAFGVWQYLGDSPMPIAITIVVVLTTCLSVLWLYVLKPTLKVDGEMAPENCIERIRGWLDTLRLPHKLEGDGQSVLVTTDDGVPIQIFRMEKDPNYLNITSKITLQGGIKCLYSSLSNEEQTVLLVELRLEIARAKMHNILRFPEGFIMLIKRIPITPSLSEGIFMDSFLEVHAGTHLVKERFLLSLSKYREVSRESNQDSTSSPPVADTQADPQPQDEE